MTGLQMRATPDMTDLLELVGPCSISGALYDLGHFPGLVPGNGVVTGELYRLKYERPDSRATEAFTILDRYERYDADHVAESLYERRLVRLVEPDVDAWIYVFNRPTDNHDIVASGNWRTRMSET